MDPINLQMLTGDGVEVLEGTYLHTTTCRMQPKYTVHTDSTIVDIILRYSLSSVENGYYLVTICLALPTSTMMDEFGTNIAVKCPEEMSALVSSIILGPSSVMG